MVTELLRIRASVRKYQNKSIPADVIQDILEAGRLSPSGGNEQAWMFGVITDPDLIAQAAQIAHQQQWIEQAPLLVVLCTLPVADELGGRDIQVHRYPEYAQEIISMDACLYQALNQEEHQTKIAGTHMALAALEQGVGSCWVSLFHVKELTKLLNLPAGCIPSEILVFGYPDHVQAPIQKKRLEEVTFYNRYG